MRREYELIGGPCHGQTVIVPDYTETYQCPVYSDDDVTEEAAYTVEYIRREFTGDEFGEGYACFGLSTDDRTEARELARMAIKSNEPDDNSDS